MGLVLIFFLGLTPQMPLSIATTDDGLSLFANPAGLGANQGWEFYYLYNFYRQPLVNNSSFVLCLGQLAGFIEPRPLRYGAALGLKEDNILAGVRFVRDSVTQWSLGAMVRPWGWLSLGGVWQGLNQDWGRVGVGLGLRPIGPRLTFFTEAYLNPVQPFVGFQVEPVAGVQVATRFKLTRDEFNFCAKMAVNLERFGVGAVGANAPREAGGYLRISEERHRNLFLEPKRFLRLELSLPVVEEKPGFSLLGMHQVRTTYELLKVLSRVKEERSIKGMVLKLKSEDMSFAQAQELKKALTEFQAEGKWLWVYAQNLGMLGYYIAAGANRIILHPMGGVIIPGVATQSIFLKGALEKLGIKPEVHRHGKYKSAVEVFTEESLSVPNREQLQALVDGLYEEFIQGAIAGRKIKEEQMESLVGIAFFSAEEAKNAGLIDTIGYEDELDSLIKKEFRGYQAIKEQGLRKTKEFSDRWDELGKIAVIYAAGSIVQGESGTNFLTGEKWVGSSTICRALCEAREDKKVKGIVLRVDSPGGDGVASDIIWREIELTRKKKPVVVSMGGMAASGGYYISCNADKIFALPGTVTGSIGVFDIRMVTEGLYNKLGIKRQVVKRGEHADVFSDARELTPREDSIFQSQIDWFYQQFVEKVARGRNLPVERIDSVGQGRIWLGRDASRIGLVDSLAGFFEAIEFCRKKAKLGKDYEIVFYPRAKFGLASLLSQQLREFLFNLYRQ